MRRTAGLMCVAAFLMLACVPPRPWGGSPSLPTRNLLNTTPALGTMDVAERIKAIDENYRDVVWNRASHTGLWQLRYPVTHKQELCQQYMALAAEFERAGDDGGASLSLWAALGLVDRTVGSRPDKEKIRLAAFTALAKMAERKGQHRWATLLTLVADLGQAYLASEDAKRDHDGFYAQLEKFVSAEQEAEAAAERAAAAQRQQALMAAVQFGVNYAQGMMQGANASTMMGHYTEALQTSFAIQENLDNLNETLRKTYGVIGDAAVQFRQVAADDIPKVEAGQTFVPQEVAFYLASAKTRAGYFQALHRAAAALPGLEPRIVACERAADDMAFGRCLAPLAKLLDQYEVFVAQSERRGRKLASDRYRKKCDNNELEDCILYGRILCAEGSQAICAETAQRMSGAPDFGPQDAEVRELAGKACKGGVATGCALLTSASPTRVGNLDLSAGAVASPTPASSAGCGSCAGHCEPIRAGCNQGDMASCYRAGVCLCQCRLALGGCGQATSELQACIETNMAKAFGGAPQGPTTR